MTRRRVAATVFICLSAALTVAAAHARGPGGTDKDAGGRKGPESRLGIVVLQFDDGTIGHYTHAFRTLEKHNLKGSFGVVTDVLGRPGKLTAEQIVEMHRAGHEIHDHTLDHNAAFWGDPEKRAEWKEQTEQSLGILKKLGIETRGWNQPGGQGQNWTPELRETLAPYYDYVAGRVGLKPDEQCNVHWRLRDDPFCLGYGGVAGWDSRGGKPGAAEGVRRVQTQIADGLTQGLVTIPLFHVIRDEDGSAWALDELCRFIRAHDLPVMVMADAVKAVQNPRKFFGPSVEQMPNPGFARDIDGNNRPDGYTGCRYAPSEIKSPGGGRSPGAVRVAEFAGGTTTWIYGPETGQTQFTITARSADGVPRTIAPVLTFAEIGSGYQYRWRAKERCGSMTVGADWKTASFPVVVGKDVDRVKIEFEVAPAGKVYVEKVSWRVGQ